MALFSNKIESAKFVDKKEKTIEVLYKQTPESEILSTYILELDYSNQDFLDLLDELTIEQIQDNTKNYYENVRETMNLGVEELAKKYFAEWIKVAQNKLDKQDEERYALFEKYKEEQLIILQAEVDAQVERRVQEGYEGVQAEVDRQVAEGYEGVQAVIDKGYEGVQAAIDEQYKEVENYKEEQLNILQTELDKQVEARLAEGYKDVEAYREKQLEVLQAEIDLQIKQRYEDADVYKKEQLQTLQSEIDAQIKTRYEEVEEYKDTEIKNIKQNFMDKFRLGTIQPNQENLSPENATKLLVSNMQDEDTVFKTKLVIFNLPEIKNHKDRKLKMKVRKAKTVPELFSVYYEMTNDLQHTHS